MSLFLRFETLALPMSSSSASTTSEFLFAVRIKPRPTLLCWPPQTRSCVQRPVTHGMKFLPCLPGLEPTNLFSTSNFQTSLTRLVGPSSSPVATEGSGSRLSRSFQLPELMSSSVTIIGSYYKSLYEHSNLCSSEFWVNLTASTLTFNYSHLLDPRCVG